MKPWFVPARRIVEATAEQVVATGSALGAYGRDPIDGDVGYKKAGHGNREVPYWTRETARNYSVTAYRSNPMATAIIDTYTSFCVGDSGVKLQTTNPDVDKVAREFWDDPANRLGEIQDMSLRSQLLLGEKLYELLVGPTSGVVRFAPIDPAHIKDITCRGGNPLWPDMVVLPGPADSDDDRRWELVQVDDETGLREGQAMFWAPWRTLDTDVRGMPFLTPILDWLDNYDTVLSNLMDRTALARYMVLDVTVKGGQTDVDKWVEQRGGTHTPPSGSIEVHSDAIEMKPMTVPTGAMEDSIANRSVLTNIASGAGLAKTWLAEPEDANRATALTMAEPVRRRVGAVQRVWLQQQTELVRFAVDRAVAAKRLPAMVDATDPRTGETTQIPAAQAVLVTGPEVAAADSQLTAQVLLNLSTGLEKLTQIGVLPQGAAAVAARKAWEDYVGIPYTAELDSPEANPDDVAEVVESAKVRRLRERHRAGGDRDYVRDGDGQFARVPGAAAARAVSDPLNLVGRIDLAPGESFGGSARVHDGYGDRSVALARVDGPGGAKVRLGVAHPEDLRRWRAADKGGTVELDRDGVRQLRDVLRSSLDRGKANVADYRASLRAAHKAGIPMDQWPDAEADIAEGAIWAGWGELRWELTRQEGPDYSAGGVDYGVGGEWLFSLDAAPTGAEGVRDTYNVRSSALLNKLDKALADLTEADDVNSPQLRAV